MLRTSSAAQDRLRLCGQTSGMIGSARPSYTLRIISNAQRGFNATLSGLLHKDEGRDGCSLAKNWQGSSRHEPEVVVRERGKMETQKIAEEASADIVGKYAFRLIINVMLGELDGKTCSVSERLRAAIYLHKMYLDGDLISEDIPEDELSKAIRESGIDCEFEWCE